MDLFCGCGGVTEGLKFRNFKIVAAVDNSRDACKTYRVNHPNVKLYEEDIRNVNPLDIRLCNLNNQDLDVLIVCAPCQPFSSQNKLNRTGKKDSYLKDKRDNLILESVRFAKVLKPLVIFFENVSGLERFGKAIIAQLKQDLGDLGYTLGNPTPIDAANYEVPQRRKRCIMLAVLNGIPPKLPHPKTPPGNRITVRMTIGNGTLMSLQSGERDPNDPLHYASNHLPLALERLKHIPKDGGSRSSLPLELQLACHQKYDGHSDVYGRMKWDDIAPTLTTGCIDVTRGRYSHPQDDRAITLREAALLQSFPQEYEFFGCKGSLAEQVGNAVPVRLMYHLAPMLRQALKSAHRYDDLR